MFKLFIVLLLLIFAFLIFCQYKLPDIKNFISSLKCNNLDTPSSDTPSSDTPNSVSESFDSNLLNQIKEKIKNKNSNISYNNVQKDIISNKLSVSGGKLSNKVVNDQDNDSNLDDDDDMINHLKKPPIEDEMENQRNIELQNSIVSLYMNDVCPGDDRLYKKAQHTSIKNKRAIDAKASLDKYSLLPFLKEELDDNANREWWSQDDLEWQM